MKTPHAHVSLITLGVSDIPRAAQFYQALGFVRKMKAAGDGVAFFEAGGIVLSLFGWSDLAHDAGVAGRPQTDDFRGISIAWNCPAKDDVDAVFTAALKAGGAPIKAPQQAFWGGYHAFFADPDGHLWEVAHNPQFSLSLDGKPSLPD